MSTYLYHLGGAVCLALRYSQYSGYHPLSCQSMMPSTSVLVREMMIFVVARSVCVNRIKDVSEKDERKV